MVIRPLGLEALIIPTMPRLFGYLISLCCPEEAYRPKIPEFELSPII